MFDMTGIEMPEFGNHESGLAFAIAALERYETAQALYANREAQKSNESVKDVLEKVRNEDASAVGIAEEIAENLRKNVLEGCSENGNVAVVLFPLLEEIKKVVGSWRAEATVSAPEPVETDDDRDLIAEYEALDKAQTMIQGTIMMFGITPSELPEKFTAEKSKRVDGKNVPTGEKTFKFPGQLRKPNEEGTSTTGRTSVSSVWTWEIWDRENETTLQIGTATLASLSRLVSTPDELVSFADLKDRLDNRKWDAKETTTLEVPVPRGKLIGNRKNK